MTQQDCHTNPKMTPRVSPGGKEFKPTLTYYSTSLVRVLKQSISYNLFGYVPELYITLDDIRTKSDGPIKCICVELDLAVTLL
jgi:hypothetical protein